MKKKAKQKEEVILILRVSATSKPGAVAGALASSLRDHKSVELQAIGAAAVNQAVKAVAIARGFTAPNGSNLSFVPAFTDVLLEDGVKRTGMKLIVQSV